MKRPGSIYRASTVKRDNDTSCARSAPTKRRLKPGSAFSILREMEMARMQAKHPLIRPRELPRPRYSDRTANGLTRCIIHFIRLNRGQAERISCTGRVLDRRKTATDCLGFTRQIGLLQFIPASMQRGTADISATIRGRAVKIEVKIGHDRQSPDQVNYQRNVEASGGLYYIARDFQSFYDWYMGTFG